MRFLYGNNTDNVMLQVTNSIRDSIRSDVTTANSLNNVSVVGIHEASKNFVISSNIDRLNELYNISNPEIRQRMTSLFDLFYLLMFKNSKCKKIKELMIQLRKLELSGERK